MYCSINQTVSGITIVLVLSNILTNKNTVAWNRNRRCGEIIWRIQYFVYFSRGQSTPCCVGPSVHRSIPNILKFRAAFASRPLPNRPRLSCRVSGLVFVKCMILIVRMQKWEGKLFVSSVRAQIPPECGSTLGILTRSVAPIHNTPNFISCLASHWLTCGWSTMTRSPPSDWHFFRASAQFNFGSECNFK